MDVDVVSVRGLRFDDGSPVRSASALARFRGGWLVAQDDAAHAAWWREESVTRVRVVPPVLGHDVFSSAAGTKHLKPDLEAACEVSLPDGAGVLLLGSGSTPARMRGVLVGAREHRVAGLEPLYARVAEVLDLDQVHLNLEGACVVRGGALRWFARGNTAAGVPSASVDVDLAGLLVALREGTPEDVAVTSARTYDLGAAEGVGLTVTDAVALPGGAVLVSAAAEDTPNAVDDGPVVASALALIEQHEVRDLVVLPAVRGRVAKVEGLGLLGATGSEAQLLAVVDADDPEAQSLALALQVRWS